MGGYVAFGPIVGFYCQYHAPPQKLLTLKGFEPQQVEFLLMNTRGHRDGASLCIGRNLTRGNDPT